MKNSLRYLIPALGLAVVLPTSHAADDAKPVVQEEKKGIRILSGNGENRIYWEGDGKGNRRYFTGRPGDAGEKETVTFLGVATGPVSPVLTAQLGLPEGSGLVVVDVEAGSPAAGMLKEHDVLLKLDDQILIEQPQLSVLVRNHKEGDEITLTYLRGGKQATARVKLAKHEVLKTVQQFFNQAVPFGSAAGVSTAPGNSDWVVVNPTGPQNREMIERMLPLMGGVNAPGVRRYQSFSRIGGTGSSERDISVTVNTGNSRVVLDDDKGSIELTIKDGKKDLVAKNTKGEQIFSGPVNTPEDRRALPGDVRERLDRLEDSTQFSYKPGDNFKAETKVVRPFGQGIAMPPQATTAPERRFMSF